METERSNHHRLGRDSFALTRDDLVHLVALLTAVMGAVNVLSAITPAVMARLRLLEGILPFAVESGGRLTSALSGFGLLLLSVSLWRKKQLAWMLTLAILLVSIPAHLIKGLDYEEATLSALLAALLIYLRPNFQARSDVPSMRQGLQVLLAAFAFTLLYGVAGFYLLDRHFSVRFGLGDALRQTLVMFTQFYDPGLEPITGYGRYFAASIYAVGAVTFGYALLMLLRPVLIRRGQLSLDERASARQIVEQYGESMLARFALFDDKSLFFASADSLIAYVVENRVALALGDPIGRAGTLKPALEAFRSFCARNDWMPAFHEVKQDNLSAYRAAGFDALAVGQAAIIDLQRFTLEGSSFKPIRNSYNKLVRLGYRFDVIEPPYSPRMLRELSGISDEWLSARNASELRFSLGWFDEDYLRTCPIVLVRDREGFIEAFANVIVLPSAGCAAIDLMRQREQIEPGLMDFLFASLLQWAKDRGLAAFDLGLSPLAGPGPQSTDRAATRTLRYIFDNLETFYNFQGLHSFKQKFNPAWSSRYLIYPNAASLPAVSVALIRAHLGGAWLSALILPRT